MGLSTFLIGLLPGYGTIGIAAPLLLALCRCGQGIGLGGEWGGAVLLAIENAPAGKRAIYGMFPQLGAPIGFLLSGSSFLLLSRGLTGSHIIECLRAVGNQSGVSYGMRAERGRGVLSFAIATESTYVRISGTNGLIR